MNRKQLWICILMMSSLFAQAQKTRYIVQLKDKASSYNLTDPSKYLSQRSIDRRTRYGIAVDSTDLPVVPRYIDSLKAAGAVTVLNASRWLNQVSIQTTDAAALAKINSYPFVRTVQAIASELKPSSNAETLKFRAPSGAGTAARPSAIQANYFNYGASEKQIAIHNGIFLHNIGLRGQGMVIGMLDAGFYNYTSLKAFDSVNKNGQVLGTWDFVAREKSVTEDHSHGMACFSIIAANIPGEFTGSAPHALFYLYRTEEAATEYPIEEHNWVCAAETLDSAGGDVISSSLGYASFDDPALNHTYSELNGNTTMIARGADLAAKKGLLVLNAAGNDGDDPWKYILTPADADSILAVGAVTNTGQAAAFLSYGPSSDEQVKPDVASVGVGTIIQGTNNVVAAGNGTSYACPNMAGLATCLWQGFPELSNMRIIDALRKASNRFSTPDDRTGYGIPDVKKALLSLLVESSKANVTAAGCQNKISWTSKDVAGMRYEIERKEANGSGYIQLATVNGSGNIFAQHSYNFTDPVLYLSSESVTYRIRQVIDSSVAGFTAAFIDTVVYTTAGCNISVHDKNKVQVIPNPNAGSFSLRITDESVMDQLKIIVSDIRGRAVATYTYAKPAGMVLYPIQLQGLQNGAYNISLYNNNRLVTTERLVLINQ